MEGLKYRKKGGAKIMINFGVDLKGHETMLSYEVEKRIHKSDWGAMG